jgi:hypothetical protein
MKNQVVGGLLRFTRWLFGSPFRNLPPGLEEHAPGLELFEAEMEDMQQHAPSNLPASGESPPHHKSDTIHSGK